MKDLIDRLLEPDWHDPACPFRKHCYCDDGAPHDAVRHPLAREAAEEIASLRARVEAAEGALVDLMSWFPKKPSDPEWRIKGGVFGADDAVEHARSLVKKELDT